MANTTNQTRTREQARKDAEERAKTGRRTTEAQYKQAIVEKRYQTKLAQGATEEEAQDRRRTAEVAFQWSCPTNNKEQGGWNFGVDFLSDEEVLQLLNIETETEEITETTETEATETTETTTNKEEIKMETTTIARRANKVTIATTEQGMVATFYKTHDKLVEVTESDIKFKPKATSNTGKREEFRQAVIKKASKFDIQWKPELQEQAWDRKYWKYETDEQVEEDAVELMRYTIAKLTGTANSKVEIVGIGLDSIVANESNLSYVENGKYTKSGNWAVATVNIEVQLKLNEEVSEVIYPIEMRSGQLTKIKLTVAEFKAMIEDVFETQATA